MDIVEYSNSIRKYSESLAKVVSACRSLLHSSEAAEVRAYLAKRLSSKSINDFDIGYFPSNENIKSLYTLIGKDVLHNTNLLWHEKVDNRGHVELRVRTFFNHHNLIIPYSDEYGNIVALAGRSILGSKERSKLKIPKYKNTVFNKSMHLFGMDHAKQSIESEDGVIVVEGQIDVINCHANGFFNVVAMTSSELTPYQAFLIKKRTNNIYLLLDNDDAGRRAEQKIIKNYSHIFNILKLELPKRYNDVDEYLLKTADRSVFDIIRT